MTEAPTATKDFADPFINFQRTDQELEMFFLFSIAVAGKSSRLTKRAVKRLIGPVQHPCRKLRRLWVKGELQAALEESRIGKHTIMMNLAKWMDGLPFFTKVSKIGPWLRAVGVPTLTCVPGIGPKTARFFLMYTRAAQSYAVLDRHILAWLRDRGHDVPVNTPQDYDRYAEIEKIVLQICTDELIAPIALDHKVWLERRR